MKVLSDKDMKKIPVLTDKEIIELGKAMYHQNEDELAEKRFWKEVYEKRGLKYKK
ncbi:MAG: hypothetical protein AB2375_01335 [Tissierellaceae bacterium]